MSINIKVPVTEMALFERLARKLKHDGQKLRRCREGSKGYTQIGDYYSVNSSTGLVVDTHINIEIMARKLGVIREFEYLEVL